NATITKAAASALAPDSWLGIRYVAQPGCLRRFLGGNRQHRSLMKRLRCHIRAFLILTKMGQWATSTGLQRRAAQFMPESRGAMRTVCLATWHHDREKVCLSLNMRYISQPETQSLPSHGFLERQILPPDFLVVLQRSNRPSKAHLPFLQDICTITQ